MERYNLLINLDKIDEKYIERNKDGQRVIRASLVHNPKTWSDGNRTWGFLAQWWKDDTLPQGQYPNHPSLGYVRPLTPRKEEDQHTPQESPF